MYRNITILNYEGEGIGLSHNPATGVVKTKNFATAQFENSSNGCMAIASFYLNAIANAGLEEKATFNFVSLDNVAIKAFTIRKLMKDDPNVSETEVLNYLTQNFYEDETIVELESFIVAYMSAIKAGHKIGFRKMSEVQDAKTYKGTLTATQKELLKVGWDKIMPQKELQFAAAEEGLL